MMSLIVKIFSKILTLGIDIVKTTVSSSLEEFNYSDHKHGFINLIPFFTVLMALVTAVVSIIRFIVSGGYANEFASYKTNGIFAEESLTTGTAPAFYSFICMSVFLLLVATGVIATVSVFRKNNSGFSKILVTLLTVAVLLGTITQYLYQVMETMHPHILNETRENVVSLFFKINDIVGLFSYQTPGSVILIVAILSGIVLFIILYNSEETSILIRNTAFGAISYLVIIPLSVLLIENVIPLILFLILFGILYLFIGTEPSPESAIGITSGGSHRTSGSDPSQGKVPKHQKDNAVDQAVIDELNERYSREYKNITGSYPWQLSFNTIKEGPINEAVKNLRRRMQREAKDKGVEGKTKWF